MDAQMECRAAYGITDITLKAFRAWKLVNYCNTLLRLTAPLPDYSMKTHLQLPRREECPICVSRLPCYDQESVYMICWVNLPMIAVVIVWHMIVALFATLLFLQVRKKHQRSSERMEKHSHPDAMISLVYSMKMCCMVYQLINRRQLSCINVQVNLDLIEGTTILGTHIERGKGQKYTEISLSNCSDDGQHEC